MPQPRKQPLFELSGQWIAAKAGSPYLHRYWTELGTGRTRRESLGTQNLEEAKRKLAEAVVLSAPKTKDTPLSAVLLAYFEEHTDNLPSKDHARLAGRTLLECWGDTVRVSQLTPQKQKHFATWSVGKDHALSYISRNLSVLSAALHHAKLNEPKILFGKTEMQKEWSLQTKARRKVFIPTDDELALFLDAECLPDSLLRWAIVSMFTGGRPEAVLDITPEQRNHAAGLVDLNPEGRPQNKKYRPIVRASAGLSTWLNVWGKDMEVTDSYCGYATVDSLQSAICRVRVRKEVNLPKISAYSFRHKAITVMRQSRVTEDEIAKQVGHVRPHLKTTAGYGEWDPDYLINAANALDAWVLRLQQKMRRRSVYSPATLLSEGSHLRVVA